MVANHLERDELVRQLAWQHAAGVDEVLLDDPASDIPLMLRDILPQKADHQQVQHPEHEGEGVTSQSLAVYSATNATGELSPSQRTWNPAPSPEQSPAATNTAGSAAKPMQAELATISTLDGLRDALGRLDQCPLKHTASNMIFADGNPGARLMVISEVPGREEDRVGLPLVGSSGQLFDRMLTSIGLTRADIYITSLLPWRPPGNRTPTAEEMDMLLPWLYRHVQLAAPQQVLLLGGEPAKAILPDGGGILKLRGRWKDIDFGDAVMRPTMATLHPSYLLRSPAQKRLAFADLVALAGKLR